MLAFGGIIGHNSDNLSAFLKIKTSLGKPSLNNYIELISPRVKACSYNIPHLYDDKKRQSSFNLHKEKYYTICGNIRLFNRVDLGKLLRRPSNVSDAEIILSAYLKWGMDFLSHLDGVYAFIIFDEQINKIIAGRDPMGIQPFFYAYHKETFYFASQIKGLANIPTIMKGMNMDYIDEVLVFSFLFNKEITCYNGINRLPPGHFLILQNKKVEIKTWFKFDLTKRIKFKNDEEYLEAFREKLAEAVNKRIDGISKLGVHFSGGVDCTGIAAIAKPRLEEKSKPLFAYTSAIPLDKQDNEYGIKDERSITEVFAKDLNLKHLRYTGGTANLNLLERAKKVIAMHHSPSTLQSFHTCYFINREAEKDGVKALLSGLGGDEGVSHRQAPLFLARAIEKNHLYSFMKDAKTYNYKQVLTALFSAFPNCSKLLNLPTYYRIVYKDFLEATCLHNEERIIKEVTKLYEKHSHSAHTLQTYLQSCLHHPWITYRLEAESAYAHTNKLVMLYPWLDTELLQFFLTLPSNQIIKNKTPRLLYRQAISKWMPNPSFVNQQKSSVLTAPNAIINVFESLDAIKKVLIKHKDSKKYNFINFQKAIENVDRLKKDKTEKHSYQIAYSYLTLSRILQFLLK